MFFAFFPSACGHFIFILFFILIAVRILRLICGISSGRLLHRRSLRRGRFRRQRTQLLRIQPAQSRRQRRHTFVQLFDFCRIALLLLLRHVQHARRKLGQLPHISLLCGLLGSFFVFFHIRHLFAISAKTSLWMSSLARIRPPSVQATRFHPSAFAQYCPAWRLCCRYSIFFSWMSFFSSSP